MEYVKGIPLKDLSRLICRKCLADLAGMVQMHSLTRGKSGTNLDLCDKCKEKCIEFVEIREKVRGVK